MSARASALAALCAAACVSGGTSGPVEVKYDRDTCAACSMVLSEPAFATEVRGPDGKLKKFDDLGCALKWLERQPFRDDPAVALWVTAPRGGWVDARAARFAKGVATPMGYGYAPADEGALDFAAVRAALREPAKTTVTQGSSP